MNYILEQLQSLNYISTFMDDIETPIKIILAGWDRIEQLKEKPYGTREQAFIAMWFDKSTDPFYFNGIKIAFVELEMKELRMDLVEHNNKICDEIIAEIKRSKFLVADFTGNRGGVYFEAGFAQGLGIPVIWMVKKGEEEDIHFDTRQYNHIVYEDEKDLIKKLKARIQATIL